MPRYAQLPNIQPARLDITHYRGDSLSMRIRLQSQGRPVDVSTWSWLAQIRTAVDGEQINQFAVLKTVVDGADPVNGIIRLVLTWQAARMLPEKCVWDLEATAHDMSAEAVLWVRTVLRGNLQILPDVTVEPIFTDSLVGGGG